jgi:hypothetical protein
VTQLGGALRDRAALIVRKNDYPIDPEGPKVHDDNPVPAIALILWAKDPKALVEVRESDRPERPTLRPQGPQRERDRLLPLLRGRLRDARVLVGRHPRHGRDRHRERRRVHDHHQLRAHDRAHPEGPDPRRRQVPAPLGRRALRGAGAVRAAALETSWCGPTRRRWVRFLRAESRFSNAVVVDWNSITPLEEQKILRATYGGRGKDQLTQEEREAFDAALDARLKQLEDKFKAEQLPALAAKQERWFTWFEAADAVLAMVALDPKSWDLTIRAPIPMVR